MGCVMLYPCMFCVALSMDLFVLCVTCLTVFVNCLVKQFAICLGVFVILLLNVMELLSVVAILDRPCMVFHRMFICVILHTMSLGKSLQLLCIFSFGMLCLSTISMMFVSIMLAVCILLGMVV